MLLLTEIGIPLGETTTKSTASARILATCGAPHHRNWHTFLFKYALFMATMFLPLTTGFLGAGFLRGTTVRLYSVTGTAAAIDGRECWTYRRTRRITTRAATRAR